MAPSPASPSAPPLPSERRRAVGPIGHPDFVPISHAFLQRARAEETRALANHAIAARWCSSRYYHPHDGNDHPERDQKLYTIRGNWAMQKGLMQAGLDGYTDEVTAPCEESGCACSYTYIYHLRDLPETMLTARGLAERRKFDAIWTEMKRKNGEPKITLGAVRNTKDKP